MRKSLIALPGVALCAADVRTATGQEVESSAATGKYHGYAGCENTTLVQAL